MKNFLTVFMISLAIIVSGITVKASAADDPKKANLIKYKTVDPDVDLVKL